jgi:hypothetical protein
MIRKQAELEDAWSEVEETIRTTFLGGGKASSAHREIEPGEPTR